VLDSSALDEAAAKRLLAAYGITVTREEVTNTVRAAVAAAARIGYPVVLKVCDAAVLHKSDVGGVIVDLGNEALPRSAASGQRDGLPRRRADRRRKA
jgi:acetyltransferase